MKIIDLGIPHHSDNKKTYKRYRVIRPEMSYTVKRKETAKTIKAALDECDAKIEEAIRLENE